MKTRTKRILQVLAATCLVGLLALVGVGYYIFSPNSPPNRRAIIQATQEWGRLASYPESAHSFKREITGSIFTRGFRLTFTAPAADIERWLQESPGTREAGSTLKNPGVRHFQIKPGGGAQFAEVEVDDTSHTVTVRAWWS